MLRYLPSARYFTLAVSYKIVVVVQAVSTTAISPSPAALILFRAMSQGKSTSTKTTEATVDEWSHVEDQLERRKIQNRNAQRKFRECKILICMKDYTLTDYTAKARRRNSKRRTLSGSRRTSSKRQQLTADRSLETSQTRTKKDFHGVAFRCDTYSQPDV